jgi:hypothetical protein
MQEIQTQLYLPWYSNKPAPQGYCTLLGQPVNCKLDEIYESTKKDASNPDPAAIVQQPVAEQDPLIIAKNIHDQQPLGQSAESQETHEPAITP